MHRGPWLYLDVQCQPERRGVGNGGRRGCRRRRSTSLVQARKLARPIRRKGRRRGGLPQLGVVLVVAVQAGRSSSKRVLRANCTAAWNRSCEDYKASRRVTFRTKTKAEAALTEIKEQMVTAKQINEEASLGVAFLLSIYIYMCQSQKRSG